MKTNLFPDHWGLSTARISEYPALVRYRKGMIECEAAMKMNDILRIGWDYHTDDATLLPGVEEERRMQSFENLLVPLVEAPLNGVLAVVITHKGQRRWYFYSSNTEQILTALHEMPQEIDPYPLTVNKKVADNWDFYLDTIAQYSNEE